MDEENINPQNEMEQRVKKAISNELSSYMNPRVNNTTNPIPQKNTTPIPVSTQKPAVTTRPVIRTYKSDVEETVQAGHLSSINIAIAENKKMMAGAQAVNLDAKKFKINKNIIIIIR